MTEATANALSVGAHMESFKTVTAAEQALFTGICGNMHPLYVNERHAATTGAGGRLAFEFVFSALLTTALAKLCGPLHRIHDISLTFPNIVRVGDTIAARAEVIEIAGQRIKCALTCRRDGDIVATGFAELAPVAQADK